MPNERPRISIPLTPPDIVVELASVAILILMLIHTIIEYPNLPDTIASHFNAKGEADGYSDKVFLWFIPCLSIGMYAGLFFLNKHPHLHNYMVNITEENALKQYSFSTKVLRVVNFLTVLMFGYINFKIIEGAQNGSSDLGMGFLITVIAGSIILPIFIVIYQRQLNKK
ncbi:DUF1648 domain-containing protein [Winogradskyella sp. DF17]|uniref:DUF1648 domain-containing protein n=1 Tax=Winogradskyella pelagia TaxID=2819984 RepID=A0ABS3T4X3_9FLAO|nr:DUF1648 domain-containing protein [Winogradskyella sp. DF17]MBO3116785.1 DUF1648 domain-containing protein [Winogradskyella sp. DF17]